MDATEHVYFLKKLKNYMYEENIVSMEGHLKHKCLIVLTNQLGQLKGKKLETFIQNAAQRKILE
jgi:hypothetical protein